MKKILGIVALTLIAGAPVFAQDTTAIGYTLQLGGSNAGGATAKFDTTGVKQAGETPIYGVESPAPDIVTWSVVVNASGSIVIDNNPWYISGAANLVWDLVLKGPNGQPVGPAFGLGSPTVPGFFSTIMDGVGLYPQQPASFSWEYGTGPYGRLIDVDTANGANMLQYTFPSTYSYYNNNNGTVYTTTAQVLAGTGTLMGMGAGYTDLDPLSTGVERLGVGIVSDPGSVYCSEDIGAKAPIAEGQINMTGLPGGTYTLELIPGTGNNVAWSMNYMCYGTGSPGAFAVPAATVTGSTIEFVHEGATTGTLTVTIDPPGIGGQFSIDGGTTWNDATQLTLAAGSYTVTAKPVAGYATPDPQNVAVNSGLDTPVTLTYVAVQPAVITAAQSVRTHGAAGTFATSLSLVPGNATCEGRLDTRAGCDPKVVITFDKAVNAAGITVVATAVGGAAPTVGALALDGTGTMLTIPLTGSVNRTCVTLTISNVGTVEGSLPTAYTQKLTYVRADIDNNRNCGASDLLGIKQKQNAFTNVNATNYWYDLDCDSKCGASDLLLVKQLQNAFVTTACAQ